ncbi:MAG: hypothetical protein VYA53_00975 [Acidobacteriota bacterium]|nr:hypothetical protein [Acidobacteriota bacterium]
MTQFKIANLALCSLCCVLGMSWELLSQGLSGTGRGPELVFTEQYATKNVTLVGKLSLEGEVLKLDLQRVGNKVYLYGAGIKGGPDVIMDVTDPTHMKVVNTIPMPDNGTGGQIQVADNLLVRSENDLNRTGPIAERRGIAIYDVSDPLKVRYLSNISYETVHRGYYPGGRYIHGTAQPKGFKGNIYVIIDIQDPRSPREIGRWWMEGQAAGETPSWNPRGVAGRLHGPAYPVGDRAYLSYYNAMVILDISDLSQPRQISKLVFSPPFNVGIPVHTVFPLLDRQLAFVAGEATGQECRGEMPMAWMVDLRDEGNPLPISTFPIPTPPSEYPFRDFCAKLLPESVASRITDMIAPARPSDWRFGPHNIQHVPRWGRMRSDIIYLTYFVAGLRIFDISNPFAPREVGYFIAPDSLADGPVKFHDLMVDHDSGIIYVNDQRAKAERSDIYALQTSVDDVMQIDPPPQDTGR